MPQTIASEEVETMAEYPQRAITGSMPMYAIWIEPSYIELLVIMEMAWSVSGRFVFMLNVDAGYVSSMTYHSQTRSHQDVEDEYPPKHTKGKKIKCQMVRGFI